MVTVIPGIGITNYNRQHLLPSWRMVQIVEWPLGMVVAVRTWQAKPGWWGWDDDPNTAQYSRKKRIRVSLQMSELVKTFALQ